MLWIQRTLCITLKDSTTVTAWKRPCDLALVNAHACSQPNTNWLELQISIFDHEMESFVSEERLNDFIENP